MAASPAFAATPVLGGAKLGTAETDLQVPTQTSTVVTAAATGTKIEEIVVEASIAASLIATTVPGLVYIFLYDGVNYRLFDVVVVTAATASSSAAPFRTARSYSNLVLPTGWSVRCSQSIAGNANLLQVVIMGGDL